MTYEIVKQIGTEQTGRVQRESHLVKLDTPTVCRANSTFDLYEVNYVIVEALRIFDSGVEYEETHVVASDAEGKAMPAILYQGGKALTVPEAMFSIGEHNYDPTIETDPEREYDNGN